MRFEAHNIHGYGGKAEPNYTVNRYYSWRASTATVILNVVDWMNNVCVFSLIHLNGEDQRGVTANMSTRAGPKQDFVCGLKKLLMQSTTHTHCF